MSAKIYQLPVRRRPSPSGPRLEDHPRVKKALLLLPLVHPYLFLAVLETVREYERTGRPIA